MRDVAVIGASGKLGRSMVRHALARGYRMTAGKERVRWGTTTR